MRPDYHSKILLTVVLSLGCALPCCADIYVIASPEAKLTLEDIREIYLGDKEFSGDIRLVPVDNQAALAEFVAKAFGMNAQRYNTLWVRKAFRDALTPPVLKAGDFEVLEFVKRTRGAVGYVSSVPRDKEISVVGKF